MTPLHFIVEPRRLLMTWQPSDESGESRMRRVVGEVIPDLRVPQTWRFNYLLGTRDVEFAMAAGFEGYPAFKLDNLVHEQGVRETLLRRLPSRRREDFSAFLRMHRLPDPFTGTDLALLGYTGARLPSDGFSFVPVFPLSDEPCEFLLEIAGLRHVFAGDLDLIRVGDPVNFTPEPSNKFDPRAIAIFSNGRKLGFVNRAMLGNFHHWLESGNLHGRIERKNGKMGRPLLFVRVMAQCPSESDTSPYLNGLTLSPIRALT